MANEKSIGMISNIMSGFITIALIASAGLGYFSLTRLKSAKREFFVLFVFCVSVFELGYLLELSASTADGGFIATKIIYAGSELIAPMFLVFVQKYCDRPLSKSANSLIFASAFFIILLVWTSDRHTLYYTSYWYDSASAIHHLGVERGILYPLGFLHPMLCTVASVVMLVQAALSADKARKKRLMALVFGALAPLLAYGIYFFRLSLHGADFAPIILIISIILLYPGLIKHDLLENEETIRAQKLLKDMIDSISRDLRTPLTVLGQYLELLDDSTITLDDKERADYIHIAYSKHLNFQRLIRNLVDLNLIESEQLTFSLEWYSASKIASEIIEKYSKYVKSAGIAFSVECARSFNIRLDPDKIWSVLDNIICNAVGHTPEGGVISVIISCADKIGSIRICDTGKGIEKQHLPYVFDRFYTVARARSVGSGYSGVGLYIAGTMALCMNGTVTAESEPGIGSAFTVTLAAEELQQAAAEYIRNLIDEVDYEQRIID